MTTWAYIATPSGAPLDKTLGLANGKIYRFQNVGLIHRRINNYDGTIIQFINQLNIGDELILMYNLFHVGLIYPISSYEILDPYNENMPLIIGHDSYPAIGYLDDPHDFRELEPDYLGNRDPIDDRHYVIRVRSTKQALPRKLIGKVCIRSDNSDHALVPFNSLKWIEEKEGIKILDALLPKDDESKSVQNLLAKELNGLWNHLDGRSKQLTISSKILEEKAGRDNFNRFTVPAYPLCALAEYELNKVLKQEADKRLRANKTLRVTIDRPTYNRCPTTYRLPLVPDSIQQDLNFEKKIRMLNTISVYIPDDTNNALHMIRKARNRVVHSYLIEERHFLDLKTGIVKFLKSIYK